MNYHNITKNDMLQGEGVRAALWVAGCSHHCKNCHNPETWDENGGIKFNKAAKEELFEALNNKYVDGLTLTGGDPLYCGNRSTILNLVKEVKEKFPDKNIWLYTGYTYDKIKDLEILNYIDVLVDGQYIEDLRSPNLPWVGSSNQNVINLKEKRNINF